MATYKPSKNDMKNYNKPAMGGGTSNVGSAALYANPNGQQMPNSYYMNKSGVNANAYYNGMKGSNANMNNPANFNTGSVGGGGGYSGGGGGGGEYIEPAAPSFDSAAFMQMLMNLYEEQAAKMKAMTESANKNVDVNAQAAIDALNTDTAEQLRQANILRQRTERDFPQSALVSGGGGLSESALMDIGNTYQNSRDKYNTAFTKGKSDLLNQAANIKAQNQQNLTQNEVNFMNQVPQYAMQMASMGPEYANAVSNAFSGFKFGGNSAPSSVLPAAGQAVSSPTMNTAGKAVSQSTYARYKALGMNDEQIRNLVLNGTI